MGRVRCSNSAGPCFFSDTRAESISCSFKSPIRSVFWYWETLFPSCLVAEVSASRFIHIPWHGLLLPPLKSSRGPPRGHAFSLDSSTLRACMTLSQSEQHKTIALFPDLICNFSLPVTKHLVGHSDQDGQGL